MKYRHWQSPETLRIRQDIGQLQHHLLKVEEDLYPILLLKCRRMQFRKYSLFPGFGYDYYRDKRLF